MQLSQEKVTQELLALEEKTRRFDTKDQQFQKWFKVLGERSEDFLANIEGSKAFSKDITLPPFLDKPLKEQSSDFSAVLDEFFQIVSSSQINACSGKFFGYVPGGGLPTAAFGDFLGSLTNRYAGVYGAGAGAAALENHMIEELCQLMGYGPESHGTLLSGGTISTLTAIIAARETRPQSEWSRGVIYHSKECHNAFYKSLKIAGLGHVKVKIIDIDDDFRMCMDDLKNKVSQDLASGLKPWIIASSAGTVNTGAVDPLDQIADLCEEQGIWMHVDGAYGGFFKIAEHEKSLALSQISRADSIVLDPHKGLFLPYGCGAVLVKNSELLKQAMSFGADYLEDVYSDQRSPSDYSPELTRHFRAARMWVSLRVHGLQTFKLALKEKLLLADKLYSLLENQDCIELGPVPQLSCVTFRVKDLGDEKTNRLLAVILESGEFHISSTRLNGKKYMRACVLCFRSHNEHIENLASKIIKVSLQVSQES